MPTKMCMDCEVCQDKKKVPDPLREGEMIRCMECADAPALREIDEMDCPYCGHEQDSDDWREWTCTCQARVPCIHRRAVMLAMRRAAQTARRKPRAAAVTVDSSIPF